MIAMLTVPAAVLFVLRRPLIGLLLQHGEYTALDALVTSRALAGFALGLPAFSVYLFVLRGFYAHQDTARRSSSTPGSASSTSSSPSCSTAGGACSGSARRSPCRMPWARCGR